MGWNDPNYPPKRIPNWRPGNGAVQGMEGRELGEGEERASCWDRSPWQPPPSHLPGSEPSWVTSQRAAISCREAEGEKGRMASLPPTHSSSPPASSPPTSSLSSVALLAFHTSAPPYPSVWRTRRPPEIEMDIWSTWAPPFLQHRNHFLVTLEWTVDVLDFLSSVLRSGTWKMGGLC